MSSMNQWPVPFGQLEVASSSNNVFDEPNNLSGRQLTAKIFIGLAIWWIIAVLLFVIISFMSSMFTDILQQQQSEFTKTNPLLSLVLLFVGFISSFIGNMAVAGIYNLFYGKRYYDSSKIFWLLLLTNGILFFVLAPLYLIFNQNIDVLFLVMWFHILFSVFVSSCQIDFVSSPHYSPSSMIWNILWFVLAFLGYAIVYKTAIQSWAQQQIYFLMLFPPLLAYTLLPFGAGIWEKVYYKIYESGANPFYVTSFEDMNSLSSTDVEPDDINVDLK